MKKPRHVLLRGSLIKMNKTIYYVADIYMRRVNFGYEDYSMCLMTKLWPVVDGIVDIENDLELYQEKFVGVNDSGKMKPFTIIKNSVKLKVV